MRAAMTLGGRKGKRLLGAVANMPLQDLRSGVLVQPLKPGPALGVFTQGKLMNLGSATAHLVIIGSQPRFYMQGGGRAGYKGSTLVKELLYKPGSYLVVTVDSVNEVAVNMKLGTVTSFNTFVELTFNGLSLRTETAIGTTSPTFKEEFIFHWNSVDYRPQTSRNPASGRVIT